jgi:hypothetical protein
MNSLLYLHGHLAVGTPVTQRPPHRPGRAVFPHPVPRLYSLSRKAFALGKHSIPLGRYREFGFCDPEAIYGFNENLPGEAFTLATSSVQPLECTFNRPSVKTPQ